MKNLFSASALAAVVALGLGQASAALADETAQPAQLPQTMQQQQTAQNPAMAPYAPSTQSGTSFNPNTVPAWSQLRNGAGEVIDPQTGLVAPGYGTNDSGGN